MLRRITTLTGLSAAALLALAPAANAATPTDDGVGLTYGIATVVIDMGTGVADGAMTMTGLDEG